MITGTFELVYSIPKRIGEVQLLVNRASDSKDSDPEFYDALCRASAVLLAAHLEAFLKELSSNVIADLNYHIRDFAQMPEILKREFCRKIAFYKGVESSEIEKRIRQLMDFFERNNVAIDLSAFSYNENPNKNPSPDLIQSTLNKIGVPNVLHSIKGEDFTSVFDGNYRTDWAMRRKMRKATSAVYSFPYRSLAGDFSFERRRPASGEKTLWHEFIETVMTRRHSIVHGDTIENSSSATELGRDAEKLLVLMYGLSFSVATWFAERGA
ncbi:hypothetical protein KYN89_13955 [Alteriqipengyuania sp. NZ-12B]|uniref:RiboL-PSP-HEPN domain-containing protein n=1 Tax=Alteriqipengyuania abyssalis TaxID=2860200 RepID=A0ABS7PGE7_9SPHN|nr:HEPN domain-containing protein [Alteriqipengyuania abyssalis]MBY8338150.1 hypothetical protein [Alteriqipengyuania abyssalis]